jgi:hypothetical protein
MAPFGVSAPAGLFIVKTADINIIAMDFKSINIYTNVILKLYYEHSYIIQKR